MLWRSISRRPMDPYLHGDWDCWLVPKVLVSNVDVAARIGEAAAAMKVTRLVTVQLGHCGVFHESTFLLASIPTVSPCQHTNCFFLPTYQLSSSDINR